MVNQSAGRSYENIQTVRQLFELGSIPHASENDGGGQVQPSGVGEDVFMNLRGQFPGGTQNKRPHPAARRFSGTF